MRKKALVLFSGVMALAIFMASMVFSDMLGGDRDRLLHVEPSQYAPVVVFEQYGERCMNFEKIEGEGRQTCFELDDPDRMVFEYTRMMTSALFAKPDPKSILVIGLGGGTLPMALHKLLPAVTIDTVELDPAVVKVAQRLFWVSDRAATASLRRRRARLRRACCSRRAPLRHGHARCLR